MQNITAIFTRSLCRRSFYVLPFHLNTKSQPMLARVTSGIGVFFFLIGRSSACHLEFNSGDFCLPSLFLSLFSFFYFHLLFCLVILIHLHISSVVLHFSSFCLSFTLSNLLFFIPFISLLSILLFSILFSSLLYNYFHLVSILGPIG